MRRAFLLPAIVALALAAACGGEGAQRQVPSEPVSEPPTAAESAREEPARGGTLRVGLVRYAEFEQSLTSPDGKAYYGLDPQVEYNGTSWELFRCCLLRTLLSYSGRSTEEGGAELRPDLASALPEVSSDGLTWTFRLKRGLHYAPPFEDVEIVAGDVVRAVERIFLPANESWAAVTGSPHIGPYGFYYSPLIEGAQAFADGTSSSISGFETPDDHTLIVHLTEQAIDLGERFAFAATAPIPPGAADGHDDGYGPFLVASGPYLLEEYVPGEAIVLVRNPSWDPATDDLRAAYADRIELTARDSEEAQRRVEAGELDLALDGPPPPEAVERYAADPALSDRLLLIRADRVIFATMNLATPPFDDVQVRRAVNYVIDKRGLLDVVGGGRVAQAATHLAPDSLEANLLLDYDPYATQGHRGDLEAARAEMAKSRYDTDGDGRCDHESCRAVRALALDLEPYTGVGAKVADDLAAIGISLGLETVPPRVFFEKLSTPEERLAFVANNRWLTDFPNGSGWFTPLFAGSSAGSGSNSSLVGASPEQLEQLGYPGASVPSVDREISQCLAAPRGQQAPCWARVDQILMEQVVPSVPLLSPVEVRILSERVATTSIAQFTNLPALDRIALKPEES